MTREYAPTSQTAQQLERSFTYHPPNEDQVARYKLIRDFAHNLAITFVAKTPPSREQSLALTKLEEAVMWANAAIARNE